MKSKATKKSKSFVVVYGTLRECGTRAISRRFPKARLYFHYHIAFLHTMLKKSTKKGSQRLSILGVGKGGLAPACLV